MEVNVTECFCTSMENTMAKLIADLNTNRLTKGEGCALGLFSEKEDLSVCIENQVDISARADIRRIFETMERDRSSHKKDWCVFTASPAYRYSCEGQVCRGEISCDVYLYEVTSDKKGCFLRIMRMDAGFIREAEAAKLTKLSWYTIQTMLPWIYTDTYVWEYFSDFKLCSRPVDSPNYIQLKKLFHTPWDHLLKAMDSIFIDRSTCLKLQKLFESKDKASPQIIISGMPVIEMDEAAKTARILSEIECFAVEDAILKRAIYLVEMWAQKEGVQWKIADICLRKAFELPDTPYISGIRYDRFSLGMENWDYANTPLPGLYPEDAYAIENVLNAWVYSVRQGGISRFALKYMNHPDFVPKMWIRSQGDESKMLIGLEAILEKLTGMDARFINHLYSYHTATTPRVEISADGKRAVGTWFDHSATNLFSPDEEHPEKLHEDMGYMVFLAKYMHKFQKIDGQWYLTDFMWEPLINLWDWTFNLDLSEGFVSRSDSTIYPWAFEGAPKALK